MGSLKSGLVAIALTSLLGTAAVVGCSADGGNAGIVDTTDPTVPPDDPNLGKLPPSSSSGDPAPNDAGKDATSKKDSGPKAEAGVDAGPPPPVEGVACPTLNVTVSKACGKCGKTETVCLDDGTGKGKWSTYGACTGEMGTCTPGETVTEDCGNCGKQVKTCGQYCAFTTSACTGQPMNSCKPTTVEYSTAGCATPQTYRNRACAATCVWSNFSATCEAPVNDLKLDIGAAVAALTSKTVTLSAAKLGPRITSSCPAASVSALTTYAYQYVEVHNPTAKAAKVTLYTSIAPGGQVMDTLLATYASATQPMDDAARKACRDGVGDQSDGDPGGADPTGDNDFSILKAVAIPAGGSILVYVGDYSENGKLDLSGHPSTGDVNLNVKVESLL